MKHLEDMTAAELREYANKLERDEKLRSVPVPLPEPNFEEVINMARGHLESMVDDYEIDDDFQQYLYEEVMTTIYGRDVCTWINDNSAS